MTRAVSRDRKRDLRVYRTEDLRRRRWKTPVSGIGVAHPAEAVMLTLRQVETIGDDLMLRYSVD